MDFLRDRADKLRPLSTWRPTWCRLEAHLTQPALARYRQMFPGEDFDDEAIEYTWKARKNSCEINALQPSALTKNHQGFLETAMCMLIQTHFVNSPFDDLQFSPDDVTKDEKTVHIPQPGAEKNLGLYFNTEVFTIETKTKSRGVLKATYTLHRDDWLPERLEQDMPGAKILLDNFEYTDERGRRQLKSFWISAGEDGVNRHTQVVLTGCRNF